uniref:Uncharacterized protein n=1 Tax=Naja naja TaxID=35670 RepID=A0A8C6XHQ0_NAJNA
QQQLPAAAQVKLERGVHQQGPMHKDATMRLLVEWTTPEAKIEALVVSILHRFHDLLWHPDGKSEVATDLPHYNGGANVLGLDLNVLARDLLCDLQTVGTMLVTAILRAISKGCWEFIHLCLVHFLIHTLLEALENDSELVGMKGKRLLTLARWSRSVHNPPMFVVPGLNTQFLSSASCPNIFLILA